MPRRFARVRRDRVGEVCEPHRRWIGKVGAKLSWIVNAGGPRDHAGGDETRVTRCRCRRRHFAGSRWRTDKIGCNAVSPRASWSGLCGHCSDHVEVSVCDQPVQQPTVLPESNAGLGMRRPYVSES